METNYNKRFDETINKVTLDNGLTVILVHKPNFRNHVALLGTNFGAKHLTQIVNGKEVKYHSGVAHFLEHKLFEKPEEDILSTFTNMGASANAFTSYSETVYYFSTTQALDEPLNTLLDFVLDLDISESGVQKEKGIIIEELKMYQEMPFFRLSMEAYQSMFHHHPLKYDIAGTKEDVLAITKEELELAYNTNYHSSQLVLSIVSPMEPKEILELINNNERLKQTSVPLTVNNPLIDEPKEVSREYFDIDMKVNASKHVFAFKQNLKFDSNLEMIKSNIMAQLILDLNFSKLNPDYQEWLNQGYINDLFVYQSDFGLDYGYIEFIAETNKESLLNELILDKMNHLEVKEDKLIQLKKRYLGEAISDFSDFESFAINNFRAHWLGTDPFEMIEVLESITIDELNDFILSLTTNYATKVTIFA